jgi:Cohesin loading factor
MPYKADQLHLFQHQEYPHQPCPDHRCAEIQYETTNTPVRYAPLPVEAVAPERIDRYQQIHPIDHMNQHHYSQPSIQQQYLPPNGYQQGSTAHRQAPTLQQPSIQVELPSSTALEWKPTTADYQILLLSLADEYLDAAHSSDMLEALGKGEAQLDDYYKLISTALGCMEAVLKKSRLPPLKEAQTCLRFARTLYDETDNDLEAETALGKGIDLCERNKLLDLKYTMQILLSRVLYRSNAKAASKAIDGIIEDVVVYKHTTWEYAFRFLRATLSLSMPSHHDFVAAIHHLQKISELARRRGDHAIFAFAAATEALAHLQSSNTDSIDQAQRALAATRQVQLNQDVAGLPQLQVLVQFVDLCCSMRQSNLDQIDQKLSTMQQIMDQTVDDANWLDNGSILLPLAPKSVTGITSMGGDIVQERGGRHVLAVAWLPKKDVYAVGYLLSAVATSHKNAQGDHKAELFIDEGLALIRSHPSASQSPHEPLSCSTHRTTWRKVLECQFLLEKVFLLCARSEWEQARTLLNGFDSVSNLLGNRLPSDFRCLARYLDGAIYQGIGSDNIALTIFQSSSLALPPHCHRSSPNNLQRDISLLAAINTILIIRSPSHPAHHLLPSILSKIDPYLSATPNKHLLAARSLLISNLPPTTHQLLTAEDLSSTLLMKKHLGKALNIAKTIGNAQITAMTLSVMSARFFKGVVGEQAEKSARAGQNMAYRSGMRLWMSVSNGMLAETLERQGKEAEAERWAVQAVRLAGQMPKGVQRAEGLDGEGRDGNERRVNASGKAREGEADEDRDELA